MLHVVVEKVKDLKYKIHTCRNPAQYKSYTKTSSSNSHVKSDSCYLQVPADLQRLRPKKMALAWTTWFPSFQGNNICVTQQFLLQVLDTHAAHVIGWWHVTVLPTFWDVAVDLDLENSVCCFFLAILNQHKARPITSTQNWEKIKIYAEETRQVNELLFGKNEMAAACLPLSH